MRSEGYDRIDQQCERVWSRYHGFLSSAKPTYVYRQHDDEPLDFVLPYFSDNPSGML
jgi:hypothetical protein